jgi:PAS domain S-box-containing protein
VASDTARNVLENQVVDGQSPHYPPRGSALNELAAPVLLVDDRVENLLALEAVLADLDVTTVRAGSGEEALRRFLDEDFAAVLLDVQMPGLGGFEVAQLVRSRARSRATPIIFVTAAEPAPATLVEAYRLGAVDFLVKPLVPEVVRGRVAALANLFREKERARRETEQLRLLVQGTTDYAIFMLDPAGRVATWNAGAERLKGYTAGEAVGRHFSVFYPQDDLARGWPEEELRRATAVGRFEDEGWRVRKDGSRFWANVVITALRDRGGELRGFSKVTRDLTERREREEALRRLNDELECRVEERTGALEAANNELRRKEAELTDFVENATVGLHWVGPDGTILWANRAEFELLGYAREEYVGRPLAEFHADPSTIADILCRLADGEELKGYEARLRCKDGTVKHVLINSNVLWADGRFVHTRCFTRDITERKQAEEALRESNRRKDEFLATLAHELRNPLAPLRNAVAVLQMKPAMGESDRLVSMMERQLGVLVHMVDDLLDVSRVTSGKIALRVVRFDLREAVDAAVETVRPAVESTGHDLSVRFPSEPLWLDGDPTRLAQVFTNLLNNACKYTPDGGRIELTAEPRGGAVVVRVADSGVGLPADMLPKVFEVFTQVELSIERAQGGLGLGLALVQKLVELHGGAVWAESPGPGQGSTFFVRLPLASDAAGADAGARSGG